MSMGSSTKTPQRTASYRWSLPVSRVIHSCTFNKVALLLTFFVMFLINSFLYDSFLCYIACNHVAIIIQTCIISIFSSCTFVNLIITLLVFNKCFLWFQVLSINVMGMHGWVNLWRHKTKLI